jgi:hypothetical protein
MVDWYLAPSLETGRSEVNRRWPNRDRRSDGTIGDEAHASRASDHNPNSRGSVNAWDVDVDGVDIWLILATFERHPSAHYWIYNRRIADRDNDWRPVQYTGSNPHTAHAHLSIRQSVVAERNTQPWGIYPSGDDDMSAEDVNAIKAHIDSQIGRLGQFLTYGENSFFNPGVEGRAWVADAVTLPYVMRQNAEVLAAIARIPVESLAAALASSPEALAALTSAMRDQLPLIPTAQEVAKAVLVWISAGVHNGVTP